MGIKDLLFKGFSAIAKFNLQPAISRDFLPMTPAFNCQVSVFKSTLKLLECRYCCDECFLLAGRKFQVLA